MILFLGSCIFLMENSQFPLFLSIVERNKNVSKIHHTCTFFKYYLLKIGNKLISKVKCDWTKLSLGCLECEMSDNFKKRKKQTKSGVTRETGHYLKK